MNSPTTPLVSERAQGLVLGMVGLGVIGLSVFVGNVTADFLRSARRAEGTVTALEAGNSHVRVEFMDQSGRRVVFPGNGWISHRVGERVPVVYSDDNPTATAHLDEPGSVWSWTVSLAAIGVGLSLTGTYLIRKRR